LSDATLRASIRADAAKRCVLAFAFSLTGDAAKASTLGEPRNYCIWNLMPLSPIRRKPLKILRNDEYVTFLLDRVNEQMKSQGSALYERECSVTLRELRLLRFVGSEPGLTLTRLIEGVWLEKTLASKAVTNLVQRGLVVRSVGAEDARQINLHLTEAGVAVVMAAEPIGRLAESTFRAALTEEEHAVFRRCLDKLAHSVDDILATVDRQLASGKKRTAARRAA
jgi:MarR family transcriptional regulator, temperature-dependent positive regulator of motility